MHRLTAALAFTAAMLAALLAPATPAPAAGNLSCGQQIVSNFVVTNDIHCSGFGVRVDGQDITLDLNGHSITGDGGQTGVIVDGPAGVTVKNGKISGFNYGVRVDGVQHHVTGLVLENNSVAGVLASTGRVNVIDGNTIRGGGRGVDVQAGAVATRANGNKINGAQIGIVVDCDGGIVQDNTITNTTTGAGILLTGGTGARIQRNTTTEAASDGILVREFPDRVELTDNTANRNHDDGIHLNTPTVKLTRNHADNNVDLGIQAPDHTMDGGGNTARGNGDKRQCTGVRCTPT